MEKKPMMYQQRTLDFEATQTEEQAYVAESTSEPPPADQGAKKPLPLIRPDRQIVYPDAPNHYHWPDAKLLHDHDTITVDRITDDIDGPAHRFVIKRGDTVEAYMAHDNFHVGEVIGISHAKQEVRVAWDSTLKKGGWFHVGCIYPATEPAPARPLNGQPLSQVIATVNAEHGNGLTEADRVPSPSTPVTAAAILDFLCRHAGQEYSTGDLRHQFDCKVFDPAHPLENPVHQALRELRDSGKAHVVEPRWGEPRFSVLDLPDSAAELTLADCPQSLSGPEIRRLFTKHKQTIAEFATRCGFTQKHVREVFERGLEGQNAVRDWLEAILTPAAVAGDSTATAPTSDAALVPYTFEDFKKFHSEFSRGGIAYDDYREQYERLLASQNAVKQELMARYKAKEMAVLASRFGSWHAKRSTKEDNAAHIVKSMLSSFVLDGTVSYQPLSGETYEDAVTKKVRATTAGEYARSFEKRQEESQAHEKALSNPETFAEFRTFIIDKGEEALSDEQLARYDALHADVTRERRASEAPATVAKFQSEDLQGISFQIKEGFHDKRHCPLWIVQLETRVEREAFNELNRKTKMLSGWYSSFKKSDAGFQFLSKDNADKFCSLLQGDADRKDVLEARKERKELSAAERLHELAADLCARAEETIDRSNDSLQNTARRADIQAGVRGRAYADQAMARTLHSIAESLSRGEANYLAGIRHKTHAETLDAILSRARWERIRAHKRDAGESNYAHSRRVDRIEDEPIGPATIRFVEYPYPHFYKRTLQELLTAGLNRNGVKQAAQKMQKRLARESDDYISFKAEHDIEAVSDFLDRSKAAGLDAERATTALEHYKRLQRAGITDIHELRAALREYLSHRGEARGDSPILIAERELIGKKLPGFFPTPRPVIEQMLELAAIESHHRVLEPSCGKGDILDALKESHQDIVLHAIEWNRTLSDVLSAKGHDVEYGDFLEHVGVYDRILMNPPFEQGADMAHIQHAYSLLAAGGRLVSVISEGPFFRSDKQSTAFREWLEQVGGETEQLPEDAFQGREAFRETGVRTRLLTVDKE
jgi:hypothetical protein